jgi:hypothetical protein
MTDAASKSGLLDGLKAEAKRLGLALRDESGDGFKGEIEVILMKWMLGKKTVTYRMSLRLAEAERAVVYREAVKESSVGVMPTLTVEKTSLKGGALSGTHSETMPDGKGGTLDYGKVREALKQAAEAAGWQFRLEAGRMP